MKTNHTPAPWKAVGGFVDAGKKTVADIRAMSGFEVMEADAQLIAAAPELLAALENAADEIQRLRDVHLPRYEGKIGEPDNEILSAARAAIAKALGN